MSQSLTCSVVTGEVSVDAVLRDDIRSVKFEGGSMMLFGMISDIGTGALVRLYGKLTQLYAINQPAVFMQYNASCHTAKFVKTFLSEEDITVMEWPAQSPGINPIENFWKLINERAKEKNPRNVEKLWTKLKGEWEKISVDKWKTLIRSCSKRCQAIIESKRLHIKY